MSLNKSNQAGSATTFVIIGIILLALLLGSIYYVVQRGEQVRKDATAAKIASDQEAAQKAKDAQAAEEDAESRPPTTNTPSTTTHTAATGSANLPATGIETDILHVVAIGLLSAVSTSFVISRRGLKRPL